jgi:adenylate cyclase
VGRRPQELVHRADHAALIARLARRARLSPFGAALLATVAACLVYLPASRLAVVQSLEGQLLDLRFQLRPPGPASDAIVLVPIDEQSLRKIGRWPWRRGLIAQIVQHLADAGARTIALDLLFAEPERRDVPAAALEDLQRELRAGQQAGDADQPAKIEARLGALLDQADGDRQLARALEHAGNVILPFSILDPDGNVILPFSIGEHADGSLPAPVAAMAIRIVRQQPGRPQPEPAPEPGVLAPIPALASAAAGLGQTNIPLGPDRSARLERPVAAYGDQYLPSFALEAARQHLGIGRDQVQLLLGEGIALGDRLLPTNEAMLIPVNYRRPGTFARVPAWHLLEGSVDQAELAGKLVVVGGSAAGLGDHFQSPYVQDLPGFERHAAMIDDILRQDLLIRPRWAFLPGLGTVLFGGLVVGGLADRLGVIGATLGFLVLVALVIGSNLWAFLGHGLWLDLLLPLALLALIYGVALGHRYFIGQRQERRLRAAFKHYLSPALVDQVARDPALLRLGGEQRELTVLFADIRDSTSIAAALAPTRFAELLNEVLTELTEALFEQGGMLDKFTGDGLVAVFGAPLAQPDHALRACRAALAMQARIEPLQARWAHPDLPPVAVRIGINTGSMIIGNMGSEERFNYTVIGDEAHLGSRLEAANKDFGTRILISDGTWRIVSDRLEARELDVMSFRGIDRPVGVFELLGERPLPPGRARLLELFAAGLATFREGRWASAQHEFEQLLALAPGDRPSQLYLERCRARLQPPRGG